MGVSHSQRTEPRHRSQQNRRAKTSMDSKMATSMNKYSLHSMGNIQNRQQWSQNPQNSGPNNDYFWNGKEKDLRYGRIQGNGNGNHNMPTSENQYEKIYGQRKKSKSVHSQFTHPTLHRHSSVVDADTPNLLYRSSQPNSEPYLKDQQSESQLIKSAVLNKKSANTPTNLRDIPIDRSAIQAYFKRRQKLESLHNQYFNPVESTKVINIHPPLKRSAYEKLKWNLKDNKQQRQSFIKQNDIQLPSTLKTNKQPKTAHVRFTQYQMDKEGNSEQEKDEKSSNTNTATNSNPNLNKPKKIRRLSSLKKSQQPEPKVSNQQQQNGYMKMRTTQNQEAQYAPAEQISKRKAQYESNQSYYFNNGNFNHRSQNIFKDLEKMEGKVELPENMKKSANDINIGKNGEIIVKSWKQQYNLEEEEEIVIKRKPAKNGGKNKIQGKH